MNMTADRAPKGEGGNIELKMNIPENLERVGGRQV